MSKKGRDRDDAAGHWESVLPALLAAAFGAGIGWLAAGPTGAAVGAIVGVALGGLLGSLG